MAKLIATRTAQYPLIAEFVFNHNDTMVDVSGVTRTFGSTLADLTAAAVFEVIPLPVGAVVCGGELIVETQGAGPTGYTVSVGVNGAAASYLGASSLTAAANTRYVLALTRQLGSTDGKNVRITFAGSAAAATAGKFRLRVMYTLDNRTNETVIL